MNKVVLDCKKLNNKLYKNLLFLIVIVQCICISSLVAINTTYGTSILGNSYSNAPQKDVSPLMKAVRNDNLKEIKKIIQAGVDIDEKTEEGYTALMAAVYKGNIEIIQYLLYQGADLENYDNYNNTPLMYAFFDSQQKVAVVKFLLTRGVNIETMNNGELTPLILASLNNHAQSIKLLVEHGAKMETQGKLGRTALMSAVDNKAIEALKVLIDLKADVETRDQFSFTPFLLAVYNNDGVLMKMLMRAGCDVNAYVTKNIPVQTKTSSFDYFHRNTPDKIIAKGSKALDIARQFECRLAENIVMNQVGK
jgi:ankyrin repeat protein